MYILVFKLSNSLVIENLITCMQPFLSIDTFTRVIGHHYTGYMVFIFNKYLKNFFNNYCRSNFKFCGSPKLKVPDYVIKIFLQ